MSRHVTLDWQLYEEGLAFNRRLTPPYIKTIRENERMYAGDQWSGDIKAAGLPTPVFNVTKRVIDYMIANIKANKVSVNYSISKIDTVLRGLAGANEGSIEEQARVLSAYFAKKWEDEKMDNNIGRAMLDGAQSGDMAFYVYWDSQVDTHQEVKGDFKTKLISGANVFFSDPNSHEVQEQKYIILSGRDTVQNLKEEAKINKISEAEIRNIMADEADQEQVISDNGKNELKNKEGEKCSYIIKMWKDKENYVHYSKSCKYAYIVEDVNTELSRYPIAFRNWSERKDCYHGQSPITEIKPNQVFINKIFAFSMLFMMNNAFPKTVYNANLIDKLSNAVGEAIPVAGDVRNAVMTMNPGSMSAQVTQLMDMAISYTKDFMGATDAALGNVNPDNTSAIIAVQQASAVPLENVKQQVYQLVEDLGYIWLDFIVTKYSAPRKIVIDSENNEEEITELDFSFLRDEAGNLTGKPLISVKIDVGSGSYYSEVAAMNTLDKLLQSERIDFAQYLERIPDGIIPDKEKLLEEVRENQAAMMQQAATQEDMAMGNMPLENVPIQDAESAQMQQEKPEVNIVELLAPEVLEYLEREIKPNDQEMLMRTIENGYAPEEISALTVEDIKMMYHSFKNTLKDTL